jgi:phosphate acetyltransferase
MIPILLVDTNTYETAANLGSIHPDVTKSNKEKIQLSLKLFEEYIDIKLLEDLIGNFRPKGMTPKMFEYNLTQKAKSDLKHIVLPEGEDPRILQAAQRVVESSIAEITLLGNEIQIKNAVKQHGLQIDLEAFKIIEPNNSDLSSLFINELVELRGHKGVTESIARDLVCDVSYFGTMMVHSGLADGMVSGAVHTTQHTIRPALQIIKTKADISIVSSIFFMCLDDRVLVYGDCAVNPNPTAKQLASIAISSAETAIAFGIEPKIAMLSYSSGSSGKGEEVEKVREATLIAKKARPDLLLEGPIQYDAAVDLGVGQKKIPGSKVAGQASVLIFPDLNTGNNTYKAVQRETGAIAIGPVLQGLNKPVNDLSRALVDDIVNTIIITAIQAQGGSPL